MEQSNTNRGDLVRGEQASFLLPHLILAAMLVAVALAAHAPAIWAGFIWDDDVQLYRNPLVLAGDGLYRLWFTTEAYDYWPLTSTTLWLEWRIWGNNPMPYHVANIALHAAAAVLLWRVLRRLNVNGPAAYLAGLIFATHPVTVASVAWITERKNVLSMALYLLAILAYLRFEDRGSRRWYAFALLAAAAAMLAKASVVMLPIVLLLCAWWKRGTLTRRDLLRTLPFFALSLALGLATVWFQHHKAIAGEIVRPEDPTSRIAAAGWIVWFYLYKILIPVNLVMIYPRWNVDGGRIISFVPLGLLIACFAVLWHYRRSWGRAPLAALGYFVITLLPVLGFVSMSWAMYSLVADHFQYVSMIGVIALASGLLAYPLSRTRAQRSGMVRGAGLAACCAVVLTLGILTWRQARIYKDEDSLWAHTIQLNDRAWIAYYNRGCAYQDKKAYPQAVADFTRAIELKPDLSRAWNNRGLTRVQMMGNDNGAIDDYTKAIEFNHDYADAWYNRGLARGMMGDYEGAIADCTRAIELKPRHVEAYNNRGNAYAARGIYDRAILDYTKVIELRPDFSEAYRNRGLAYAAQGNHEEAVRDFTRTIDLKPDTAAAYINRAASYYHLKQFDKAWADVQEYKRLGRTPDPGFVQALMQATSRSE